MSMNPYVNYGYGFALYGYHGSLAYSLAELFPNETQHFQDEDGEIHNTNGFLRKVSESNAFYKRFPELTLHLIDENYLIVVLDEATRDLYDKYNAPADGIFLPQEENYSKKPLKEFAKALDILEKPQPIIWTYWS